MRIARYYCPEGQKTFSLLPQFFCARLIGLLPELEQQAEACEELGVAEASQQIDTPREDRWWSVVGSLELRVEQLLWALQKIRTLLEVFAGVPVKIRPMRRALGQSELLVPLRLELEDQLQEIPYPIGFLPETGHSVPKRGPPQSIKREFSPQKENSEAAPHWQVELRASTCKRTTRIDDDKTSRCSDTA